MVERSAAAKKYSNYNNNLKEVLTLSRMSTTTQKFFSLFDMVYIHHLFWTLANFCHCW